MTQKTEILDFLNSFGSVELADLYSAFPQFPKASVRRVLYGLRDQGLLEIPERGKYEFTGTLYRHTESLDIGFKGQSLSVTGHYYSQSEDMSTEEVEKLEKEIFKEFLSRKGKGRKSGKWVNWGNYREADVEEVEFDSELLGKIEVEPDWQM